MGRSRVKSLGMPASLRKWLYAYDTPKLKELTHRGTVGFDAQSRFTVSNLAPSSETAVFTTDGF